MNSILHLTIKLLTCMWEITNTYYENRSSTLLAWSTLSFPAVFFLEILNVSSLVYPSILIILLFERRLLKNLIFCSYVQSKKSYNCILSAAVLSFHTWPINLGFYCSAEGYFSRLLCFRKKCRVIINWNLRWFCCHKEKGGYIYGILGM